MYMYMYININIYIYQVKCDIYSAEIRSFGVSCKLYAPY